MDFRSIETFLKVSELHSFSKAAAVLGYSQSAVSTQILKLEQELGHELFDRIGHRILLTAHGHEFFRYAQHVLLLTEELRQNFSSTAVTAGHLRIAMADSLCSSFMEHILLQYQQHYPMVTINVHTGVTDDMFNLLSHNEVDLIYTLDNRITRSDLIVLQEKEVPVNFYAAASHPLAGHTGLTVDDLKPYPLYMTEEGVSYRKSLDDLLSTWEKELRPGIELGNVQVIRRLTETSQGISFLPEFVMEESLARHQAVLLNIDSLNISVWRQLIYHRGKSVTPAMKRMIELISG